jgi:hypothetical protein
LEIKDMTAPEVTSLVTSIALLVGALTAPFTAFLTWRNGQQSKERSEVLATKIKEVHDATNGMKTELVNEVRLASEAKGNLAGRAEEKAEMHPGAVEGRMPERSKQEF